MYIWLTISIKYCFILCEVLSAVTHRHNEGQLGSDETMTTGFPTTSVVIEALNENITRFEPSSDQTVHQSIGQTTYDWIHDTTTNQKTNITLLNVTSVKEDIDTQSTSQTNGSSTRELFDTTVSLSTDSVSNSTTTRVLADTGSNYILTTASTVKKSDNITTTNPSANSLPPKTNAIITADLGLNDTTPTGDEHPQLMNHDISSQHTYETYNNTNIIGEINPFRGRKPPTILLDMKSKLGIGGIYYILLVLLYVSTVSLFVMFRE